MCGSNLCAIGAGDPVAGTASFTDKLTVTGGSGAGFLVITFGVDGTTSLDTDLLSGGTVAQGTLLVQGGTNPNAVTLNTGFLGGSYQFMTSPIAFIFGTQFQIRVENSSFVVANDSDPDTEPYFLNGEADFLNTVTLSNLAVFLDAGKTNPVRSFGVSAESQTEYPTDALVAPIPEPGTCALVGAVLPLAIFVRRRVAKR